MQEDNFFLWVSVPLEGLRTQVALAEKMKGEFGCCPCQPYQSAGTPIFWRTFQPPATCQIIGAKWTSETTWAVASQNIGQEPNRCARPGQRPIFWFGWCRLRSKHTLWTYPRCTTGQLMRVPHRPVISRLPFICSGESPSIGCIVVHSNFGRTSIHVYLTKSIRIKFWNISLPLLF